MCGGTISRSTPGSDSRGLSPRVRGNHCVGGSRVEDVRSIPACAGEPTPGMVVTSDGKVYPRVCGGTRRNNIPVNYEGGLSPRVRGNLLSCALMVGGLRSIPACAGEPAAKAIVEYGPTVYPRVCGGTIFLFRPYHIRGGLSPRVRGNRQWRWRLRHRRRSIPACAGEPRIKYASRRRVKVYPRVCGGTSVWSSDTRLLSGLSPRVRGNQRLELRHQAAQRSIPACAGEPIDASAT